MRDEQIREIAEDLARGQQQVPDDVWESYVKRRANKIMALLSSPEGS